VLFNSVRVTLSFLFSLLLFTSIYCLATIYFRPMYFIFQLSMNFTAFCTITVRDAYNYFLFLCILKICGINYEWIDKPPSFLSIDLSFINFLEVIGGTLASFFFKTRLLKWCFLTPFSHKKFIYPT